MPNAKEQHYPGLSSLVRKFYEPQIQIEMADEKDIIPSCTLKLRPGRMTKRKV